LLLAATQKDVEKALEQLFSWEKNTF
jgi:hypothetical protein